MPDEGSSFNIFLPVAEAENTGREKVSETSSWRELCGRERVMVIDDDRNILKYQEEMLIYYGYSVTTFADCRLALQCFQNAPGDFDLIITDLTMPHMSGEKLGLAMLKLRGDVPIIICSGFSPNLSIQQFLDQGFIDFFQKPVNSMRLLMRIREIFVERIAGEAGEARQPASALRA